MSLALGRPLETQLYAVINHHPPHFYKVIKCHFESILHFQARPCQDPCIYGSYILQGFSHPKVESPNFKLPTAETKSLGINAQLPTDQHLDLLKMICDVPMCKSTIRGIYREYVVLKKWRVIFRKSCSKPGSGLLSSCTTFVDGALSANAKG